MEDKELIELAARAAGIAGTWHRKGFVAYSGWSKGIFNPLTDDGDALRLAVKLNLHARMWVYACEIENIDGDQFGMNHFRYFDGDANKAVRYAITSAAAQIGKEME